jgi:hypothetical protein
MSQPPRAMESILKGLGADPYLSDVILGDLAEEFDQRAAFDGEVDARRWYTTEALRAVPHLLRSAFRRLRLADAPRLIGNAFLSWLSVLPVGLLVGGLVVGVLRLFGIEWIQSPGMGGGILGHWVPTALPFIIVAMAAMPLSGLAGGYVAACLNARAPLVGSAAFGLVWTAVNLIAGLFAPSPLPTSYRMAALAMFNIAAIVGGVARAATVKPSTGSPLSTS